MKKRDLLQISALGSHCQNAGAMEHPHHQVLLTHPWSTGYPLGVSKGIQTAERGSIMIAIHPVMGSHVNCIENCRKDI